MFDVSLCIARPRWHCGPNRPKTTKMAFGESIAKLPYPTVNNNNKLFVSLNDGQKKICSKRWHRKREREKKHKIKQIFI